MSLQLTGKIVEIGETKTYPRKDGTGEVNVTKMKIGGKTFTCFFGKKEIEAMKVGMGVDVTYTEKEVEYENEGEIRKYTNYNISNIMPSLEPKSVTSASISLKGENTINLGGETFKITIEKIK